MYKKKLLPGERPGVERPHGTRTRYVAGCRCDACRKSNTAYWHLNQERAKELAKEFLPSIGPVLRTRTTSSGRVIEVLYRRRCPGILREPCRTKSFLRKDSVGSICHHCRDRVVGTLVSTDRVRKHMKKLSKKGVGYKAVAAAASLGQTTVFKIMSGERKRLRADTERRILAVDESCRLDRALISVKEARRFYQRLRKMGCSNYEINERLGYENRAGYPQMLKRDQITAKNAFHMKRLYFQMKDELAKVKNYCPLCGAEHTKAARLEFLRKRLPMGISELKGRRPCWWGGDKGDRAIYRDLHDLGATRILGEWEIIEKPKAEVSS